MGKGVEPGKVLPGLGHTVIQHLTVSSSFRIRDARLLTVPHNLAQCSAGQTHDR
jgi:hypothetical protein